MSLFAMFNAWMLYRPFFKVYERSARGNRTLILSPSAAYPPAAPAHLLLLPLHCQRPAAFLSFYVISLTNIFAAELIL